MQDGTKLKRRRGRPRSYDPDVALDAALQVFWSQGFAQTSLDELSQATGMNRPSLYAAFGDKKQLYRRVVQRFGDRMKVAIDAALQKPEGLEKRMMACYSTVLRFYAAADSAEPGRGCLVLGTAVVSAPGDPQVRTDLTQVIADIRDVFIRLFDAAKRSGEVPESANVRELAGLAAAVQHSLSLRARAGDSRRTLSAMARASTRLIVRAAR